MKEQVLFAKQMLTTAGWLQNAFVVVSSEGRLREVGIGEPTGARCFDVLLPAPANIHSHSFQRAIAGLTERREGRSEDNFWSWRRLMYKFLDHLDPEDIEAIAAQVQMEMLEAGYASVGEFHYLHHQLGGTPYEDPAELSHRILSAAKDSGIGYTHLPVLYMFAGLAGEPLAGGQLRFGCTLESFTRLFESVDSALPNYPGDFHLGVAPHSLRAVDYEGILLTDKLVSNGPIHIHIAEQTAEVEEVRHSLGATPIRWLLEHMPVDRRWCLIHATHADESELRQLAASKAIAGICPITEANLGDGIFNAVVFSESNGRMAIGSDSNVRIAMAEELRLLEYSQRLRFRRRVLLTSGELSCGRFLYDQATLGGAQALARDAGRIETGALADLVGLDAENTPLHGRCGDELLDAWIFASDDSIVTDVWAAGRHVVQDGRHINRDRIHSAFNSVMENLRSEH